MIIYISIRSQIKRRLDHNKERQAQSKMPNIKLLMGSPLSLCNDSTSRELLGYIKPVYGKGGSATYNINYHIVWCPKFRKGLTGKVKTLVEEQLEIIAETKGYKILEAKVMPDHIHELRRGVLWSPSYYIGTVGHVSAETIEKYIQAQQTQWQRNKKTWADSSTG